MPVAVHGEHVIALRQFGKHTRVVAPVDTLRVDEQQGRTVVGPLYVDESGSVDLDGVLDKTRPPHTVQASRLRRRIAVGVRSA